MEKSSGIFWAAAGSDLLPTGMKSLITLQLTFHHIILLKEIIIMAVKFSVSPRKDPRDQNSQPKYYVTVKSQSRADLLAVAKDINKMSTVSSVDTTAVLEAFMNVVPDMLADGKIVELGAFGTFRVSVSSEGADNPEDVTTRNITNVRIIFQPGKRFKNLLSGTEFEKLQKKPQETSAD